jgi:hypothetical protein
MVALPGYVVEKYIRFEQNNLWRDYMYTGDWHFMVEEAGNVVREHLVRDVPSAGRAVLLVWSKRIWRCPEPACPARTWSETSEQIRP